MKNKKYMFLGVALLLLASCSQEEVALPGLSADGNTTIRVSLPGDFSTRADVVLGSGLTATVLNYAIYDSDGATPTFLTQGIAYFDASSNSTTVTFNLVEGKTYDIAFFAQSVASQNSAAESSPSNAVYTFDGEAGTVTVDYTNMTSANNVADAYDCFYKYQADIEAGSTTSVTLIRPVAQVNWGTNDDGTVSHEDAYGTNGQYIQATLTGKAYTTLTLSTGNVTNETSVTLTNFAAPAGQTFPVTPPTGATYTYTYVNVAYLLVPSEASEVEQLTLSINNGLNPNTSVNTLSNVIDVANVPLQGNYRTNIFGALLTSNNTFTVTKNADWGTPDYDVAVTEWDGESVSYPNVPDSNTEPVVINRASDLAGLAKLIDGTAEGSDAPNDFEGYTITLAADFDMGGNEFPTFGSATRSSSSTADGSTSFKGTFDGQGHTISNVTITGDSEEDGVAAMFPSVDGSGAIVKNFTVENLQIDGKDNQQAAVVGLLTNGASVENVIVSSGSITADEGAAGIVGRVMGTGTVSGCENHADISVTSKTSGGIVGAAYYTGTEGITIENCTNYGNIGNGSGSSIGGIVGVSGAEVKGCTNEGTINGEGTVGGIVGIQYSCGSIENCINNATVTASGTYVGGILGWAGNVGYTLKEPIQVKGNTNNGGLTALNGQVGGIMSINRCTVYLSGNTNNAPYIKGGSAAGIVSGGYAAGTSTQTGGNGYINYGSDNVNNTPEADITGTATATDFLGTVWVLGADGTGGQAETHN